MDAGDQLASRRRKGVVERWLGMRGISCCGASWGFLPATAAAVTDDDGVGENGPAPSCAAETPAGSGMNLAAALEAERHYMAVRDGGRIAPARISLMRLLEETAEGGDGVEMQSGGGGDAAACCVCMGRRKGAAFIPCGHTFCRVCSAELRLSRGSCPLCNRSILDILHIY
ncbi:unnamed protein product [Cuscuta campestris]|nr:unnamed protein product [Cuscuta campestris]